MTTCTDICLSGVGKSCAEIVLVKVFMEDKPDKVLTCYAILDEQSNRSLAKPMFFSKLAITGEKYEYVLKSCAGTIVTTGRRAHKCVVESLDESNSYVLPTLIVCSDIPGDKNEICTRDNARYHDQLRHISDKLPEFDVNAEILLLLGRDVIEAHHIIDQVAGPPGAPFAQRQGLGWVVV